MKKIQAITMESYLALYAILSNGWLPIIHVKERKMDAREKLVFLLYLYIAKKSVNCCQFPNSVLLEIK